MFDLPLDALVEVVEHGIVEVRGSGPDEWSFDSSVVVVLKRAVRLREGLEINWAGIALALELLDKIEKLRSENKMLKQRIGRFISE
jgi:chaperone modulatory protein CbpM